MNDEGVQTARRDVQAGDRDGRLRILEEEMRVGDPLVVRSLAYVGDLEARTVLGVCSCECGARHTAGPSGWPDVGHVDCLDCARWLGGLVYLDPTVQVLASCAAAKFVLDSWSARHDCRGTGRRPRLNHMDNTFTGEYWNDPCHCCHGAHRAIVAALLWTVTEAEAQATALDTWKKIRAEARARGRDAVVQANRRPPWRTGGPDLATEAAESLRWLPWPPGSSGDGPPAQSIKVCLDAMPGHDRGIRGTITQAIRQWGIRRFS